MESKLWYLKRCSLFESLTAEQSQRLDRNSLVRKFKRQTIIYAPTEPGRSVLVLASGRVKIKDLTPEGKETILAFIEPGEIFGELSLLDEDARQEYAEAASDVEILVVPRADMVWLMEQSAELTLSITKLIGLRRRRIENRLRNLLFLSSRDRMLRILQELSESHGEWQGEHCRIGLSLSHQELASLIGVTRETVTATLGQLQLEGIIEVKRRKITIVDPPQLAEQSSGYVKTETNSGNVSSEAAAKLPK